MYGSCIEDVNHEIYGGLYSQMIFGECFEEPPQPLPMPGWSAYAGEWRVTPGEVRVGASDGAKLVRESPEVGDGEVSVDVRVDNSRGDNAGLILRVRNPRPGADAWTGYEISISPRNRAVILGRHQDNWKLLRSAPAPIEAGRWYRLKVRLDGPRLRVFLDDAASPVLDYVDHEAPLPAGRVGLRTWMSDASFRRLEIRTSAGARRDEFTPPPSPTEPRVVSGMWDPVLTGAARGRFRLDPERPFNSRQCQHLELLDGAGTAGVANSGLNRWGLTFRKGRRYAGRLYLRAARPGARVSVALQSADGSKTYASRTLPPASLDWTRFDFSLQPNATDQKARFALWLDRPGSVWVDQVSLSGTGKELFHGLPARNDLGRMLQAQGLRMLRYGGSMVNVPGYRWKQMVGDRDRRPQYRGNWYPYSTNGFGIEEFVQFCRAAGFEPVVAINIDETGEDAADLVEYLNGPATSPWGRKRAESGHSESYGVRYFEIGNEEGLPGSPAEYRAHYAHYLERFKALHAAMTRKDSALQLIIAAWWRPEEPLIRRMVEELSGQAALWDVHVWADNLRDGDEAERLFVQMRQLFQQWAPGTALKACVLEENGNTHHLGRALGHAHVLNTTERLGDFVVMDCPANCLQPWQQNDNGWDQGQVFFTSGQVWGMPPYYAQQLAARNYLPLRLASEVTSPQEELDVTATRSEDGSALVLKVVNLGGRPHRSAVEIRNGRELERRAEVWTLTGRLEERNTPEAPERIRPQQTPFTDAGKSFEYEFPPHSYTILRLRAR
jgi:alpha-L-arabinofuranosidase